MAFVVADRIKETCTSPGTGTVSLLGAEVEYQSFSTGIGANNLTFYTIADKSGANWEVGIGTVGATGTTLARTTVLSSSNSGSLVNFASGSQYVFCDLPSSKAILLNNANKVQVNGNNYLDFASANPTVIAGRQWYDDSTGSWNLGMGGGNITQQVGEELFVYGKASAAITDNPLQIVYHTGTVGSSGVIKFAPTIAGITDVNAIIGVATESIPLNGFGRITSFGVIHGINTSGSSVGETWLDDDVIWYNPITGNPTKIKPVAPNIKFKIGLVISAGSGNSGSFQVLLQSGSQLGGTDSNVQITNVTNGNILTYDGGNGYWINTDIVAGVGITITKSANGVLTITNTTTPAIVSDQANTSTGYFSIPQGTTAQRPSSPAVGQIRYNTTESNYEAYISGAWKKISTSPYSYSMNYLVIAGGGGGGNGVNAAWTAGGGGAGGLLGSTTTATPGTVYTVTVGAGGSSGSGDGSNSSLNAIAVAVGGGGGGSSGAGHSGGSGGGGGNASGGGSGTTGQGNAGGSTSGVQNAGGGGGASSAGGGASAGGVGGNGGDGTASSITGSSVTYAGGGGGGSIYVGGAGGAGGGGAGSTGNGSSGTANTGGGGGGSYSPSTGGSGGSGVVILSVPTSAYSGTITGSPTITTSGSNTIIKFTSSGTYTA